ncbi:MULTISPECIES: type VI secretion system contractile sheath small subunit [Acinetobacter]|jgi:type VI secretion system protein ImpB|uniref:Type VI secretion system contractile sheath small subunit n=1 Tax=Acinetobacter towneri TaxID=202956 RepID=A0AAP9KJ96_9GAMM|nr:MULTISPECIES: type VI secretion system contractile sheath small subunit [Acinetobacter]ENV70181.1 type VI secretion protein [Acinetobacter towneri DSM 14962 = CIP 107472]MCA4779010.1 type VI secretion system contractile sheath small subunit [Acinetobacter towneri]MCA4784338.1 type VI secretion system contractile sheath small subunit [Acinetobacter towneri]MCA4786799.1 type VI secretion system contractile sheath small subunit [Acinetobacter towneri]MCA4789691.1 type VI secretion system contr
MAKKESVQKKLQRIRPPRVQLTYDVEVGDGIASKELPFVVGVMGDFSAASEVEKTKLKDKKFINVDLDNIDEVMQSLAPRAAFQVENTLTAEGGKLSVDLIFNSMEDFRPEQVVQQVDPLRKLLEARERLTDLRNKISNSERLEDLLDEVLNNTDQIRQLSAEAERE